MLLNIFVQPFSNVVQSAVKILAIEDHAIGLEAPGDVGKRPKENCNKGLLLETSGKFCFVSLIVLFIYFNIYLFKRST